MTTASEYRSHAQECRALARHMPAAEQREQLPAMAQARKRLADEREALVSGSPEPEGLPPSTEKPRASQR
jgi:hypothetical protein